MALDDLAAQASSEIARGPQSIGKHELRASEGPKTLENVSSNHPWPPLHVPGPSEGPPMPPGAMSRSSRRHPRALPEPSWALPKLSRGSLPASCLPCASNKQRVTGQQSPASSPSPAVTSQQHCGTKERGPATGGRRPLHPATEPFRAKGTVVAKRVLVEQLPFIRASGCAHTYTRAHKHTHKHTHTHTHTTPTHTHTHTHEQQHTQK